MRIWITFLVFTQEEQLKAKRNIFNHGTIGESKVKLLDAVGYPNYCIFTPNGVFSGLSQNEQERKQFNKWYNHGKNIMVWEHECVIAGISHMALNLCQINTYNGYLFPSVATCPARSPMTRTRNRSRQHIIRNIPIINQKETKDKRKLNYSQIVSIRKLQNIQIQQSQAGDE